MGDVGGSGHGVAAARAGSANASLVCDAFSSGAGATVIALLFFCCFASCKPSVFVPPLLTTVSILMCGCGGPGVLGVTDIGVPSDAIAGFSNGMGMVGLTRDVAALGFSDGIRVIAVGWDVAVAAFSNGMGVVDVTEGVVSAAGL